MRPRRIVVVAFDGLQSLDAVGPIEVFSTTNRELGENAYALELVATDGPTVRATNGLALAVDHRISAVRGRLDTLLVAGGDGTRTAVDDQGLIDGIRRLAARSRRVGSVCTGAFLLAEAGLLDGRRATTHWSVCDGLARRYPEVTVDPDPIYVRDGNVYTSAGVTAGMDLALALVEDDLGRDVALRVARRLVLFLRRPGNQSQFSAQLSAQVAARDGLRDIQQWIADHPDADLSVAAMATRAGMSERNFARCFKDEIGTSPGRYVEASRVEVARRLLEETDESVAA
ncbi:MAG TPA: GlxA family transcriptional regulator, partial [Acidimicrobiales bacterium]|nr:GlxA family transcriptional regulator [Acidimicrobiales bacterium]